MGSLFKSLYSRFSANLVDQESTDRFALKVKRRKDINDLNVWGSLDLLEEANSFNKAAVTSEVKGFFKDNVEIESYFDEYLNNSNVEAEIDLDDLEDGLGDYLASNVITNTLLRENTAWQQIDDFAYFAETFVECPAGNTLYPIEIGEWLAEIEEKKAEAQRLVAQLRISLIGRTQIRYLKLLLGSPTFNFYPVKSIIEIPMVYRLREYWDIVGSLKKVDNIHVGSYTKRNPLSIINHFKNDNYECKEISRFTLFLN